MKHFYKLLAICIILIIGFNIGSVSQPLVYYVGNGGDCEIWQGATLDLDVVCISGGTRTVLGTDTHQQTVLIPWARKSWYCLMDMPKPVKTTRSSLMAMACLKDYISATCKAGICTMQTACTDQIILNNNTTFKILAL